MRIDRLQLTNYRGFERLDLALHPRLTVLAGVNGAGKSSVLEALSVAAGAGFLGFNDVPPPSIERDAVRQVQIEGSTLTSEPQLPCRIEAEGYADGIVGWARELRSLGVERPPQKPPS